MRTNLAKIVPSDSGLSRREFLRSGLSGCLLGLLGPRSMPADPSCHENGGQPGVLVDLTRCIGCRACESACLVRHGNPPLPPSKTGFGFGPAEKRLSFKTWTFVDQCRAEERGIPRILPVKKQCMHCLEPACAAACPVGALHRTSGGAVIYREERCIGCRYCMLACPFSIPRFEWGSGHYARVGKCDFCHDRVSSGLRPACVEACPTGALKFGGRSGIIKEAGARISARPDQYDSLYGDTVVGGTSWVYLSHVPMDELGFRTDLPDYALPSLTWKVLAKVPLVMVGVGLVLAAGLWVRRKEVSC